MKKLVLHHYPNSPFSEKIRLIMGYKSLHWTSVDIPVVMPKPDVVALTGGYRKTPILQLGADIYCDTALIADVLEAIAPAPTLYPTGAAASRTLAQWADSTLFWTAIPYTIMQPAGLAHLFGDAPPGAVQAFRDDRKAFRANIPPAPECGSTDSELRSRATAGRRLPHLRGSGTTRRAPNRTRTARHGGLPPVCLAPKECA